MPDGSPLTDFIKSGRTSAEERAMANHPSLKPQALLRKLVYAVLPLGEGLILDPFMGSGSTLAAAQSHGLSCIGTEKNFEYYNLAQTGIPKLAKLVVQSDQIALAF